MVRAVKFRFYFFFSYDEKIALFRIMKQSTYRKNERDACEIGSHYFTMFKAADFTLNPLEGYRVAERVSNKRKKKRLIA